MTIDDTGADWTIVTELGELDKLVPPAALTLEPAGVRLAGDHASECVTQCRGAARTAAGRHTPVALLVTDNQVQGLRFPTTGCVTNAFEQDGFVHFAVSGSPQFFTLSPEQSGFATIVMDAGPTDWLLVLDPSFDGRPSLVQPWTAPVRRGCGQFPLDPAALPVVSRREADALYESVFALNSEPPYGNQRKIPFRWSFSYCDAKAHAVVAALRDQGHEAGKVWVFAERGMMLEVATSSRRSCREHWDKHVAVVLRSDVAGTDGFWVIDPTSRLDRGIFSLREFKAQFGRGLGPVHLTTSEPYDKCPGTSTEHPTFKPPIDAGEMSEGLEIARCSLACVFRRDGGPPFRC